MKAKEPKQVVLAMFRYNPQLGNYCTLKIANIIRVEKNSMTVSNGYSERKFNFFGRELKPTSSLYGSAYYQVFAFEAAKELFDGEKFNGYRISRGKSVLENLQ